MYVRTRLSNRHQMQDRMRGLRKQFGSEVGPALYEVMEEILESAVKPEVPVDTGELVDSGKLLGPKETSKTVFVDIVFDAEHAAAVHEDLQAHHDQGGAKYLERPMLESAPHIPRRVAKKLRFR